MNNVHGIILAYEQYPELGELGAFRTAAALPFCGRYRLIDFALSGMMNAGIFNVDVLMQLGYQSLIDHMGGGRAWNMVRHSGGLHLMPIGVGQQVFSGTMDALDSIRYHLETSVHEDYVLLMRGSLCANPDLEALVEAHLASGKDLTAVCTKQPQTGEHNRFLVAEDGVSAEELLCRQTDNSRGVASLEAYILSREKLIEMIHWCGEANRVHLHRNALIRFMNHGMTVGVVMHEGYARNIRTVPDYFDANMAMLDPKILSQLFPEERPVATRARSDVSSYYGDNAKVTESLIADGCIIEGTVDHSIVFSGARIEPGTVVSNCILMNEAVISKGTMMRNAILDKFVTIGPDSKLSGIASLPLVIPQKSNLQGPVTG